MHGLTLRGARDADAAALWQLVNDCPELDSNSFYCYWLLCNRFAATCFVAERGGQIVGFVTSFISPGDSDVLFVWQLCVAPHARGCGVAGSLLDRLVAAQPQLPRFVEATVSPSNDASRKSFRALARRLAASYNETACLAVADFPGSAAAHEAENLVRVGPLGA
jgi:diaminobutyrate acetyltransferase